MSESNSTAPPPSGKPSKPYPEFPLFPHATKRWAKKIRGRMVYFGPWDDPEGALAKYDAEKAALHAGKRPRKDPEAVTIRNVCNAFLDHKQGLVDTGELSPRTFAEYKATTDLLIERFGKRRVVAD